LFERSITLRFFNSFIFSSIDIIRLLDKLRIYNLVNEYRSFGRKDIYLALKSGKVDVGPKTVTVQWYRNILEAKSLLDSVLLDGRVI
jgi:hypothetical protein